MKLSEYFKKNKITSIEEIRKFLLNKRLVILGNTNSHSYGKIGTKIKVTNVDSVGVSNSNGSGSASYLDGRGNNIKYSDLGIILDINEEIQFIQSQINSLNKEISDLKEKQKIMKLLKMDEWNEDQYKIYKTLQTLKTKKTDIEKAKIIAELIK